MTPRDRHYLRVHGPYDLAEVGTMGFGNRDEPHFDGVLRMALCLDGDYGRQVGVEARQTEKSVRLDVVLPSGARPLRPGGYGPRSAGSSR